MKNAKVKYSPDADALTITLNEKKLDYGEEVTPNIILHYSKEGELAEIEILNASQLLLKKMIKTLIKNAKQKTTSIQHRKNVRARKSC